MWQYLPNRGLRFWMSGPVDIVERLWSWVPTDRCGKISGATLLAMVLGYAIGTGVGIALGLLFGLMPRVYRVFSPYITALYAMPKIALAPLFVIILGIGIEFESGARRHHGVLPGAQHVRLMACATWIATWFARSR